MTQRPRCSGLSMRPVAICVNNTTRAYLGVKRDENVFFFLCNNMPWAQQPGVGPIADTTELSRAANLTRVSTLMACCMFDGT